MTLHRSSNDYDVLLEVPTMCEACHCLVAKSCPALCNPMDCRPPGSSICGIFQAGILECIAISFSRGSSQCRDQTCISYLAGGFFSSEPPGKPCARHVLFHLHHNNSVRKAFYRWESWVSEKDGGEETELKARSNPKVGHGSFVSGSACSRGTGKTNHWSTEET